MFLSRASVRRPIAMSCFIIMLVLFGIMYVVRQFAEPRLVGGFIGIHPFLSLISAYAGYRLAGIAGMVVAPMLLCLWKLIAAADTDVSESTLT